MFSSKFARNSEAVALENSEILKIIFPVYR